MKENAPVKTLFATLIGSLFNVWNDTTKLIQISMRKEILLNTISS